MTPLVWERAADSPAFRAALDGLVLIATRKHGGASWRVKVFDRAGTELARRDLPAKGAAFKWAQSEAQRLAVEAGEW
jgi:hypothetical protein